MDWTVDSTERQFEAIRPYGVWILHVNLPSDLWIPHANLHGGLSFDTRVDMSCDVPAEIRSNPLQTAV